MNKRILIPVLSFGFICLINIMLLIENNYLKINLNNVNRQYKEHLITDEIFFEYVNKQANGIKIEVDELKRQLKECNEQY